MGCLERQKREQHRHRQRQRRHDRQRLFVRVEVHAVPGSGDSVDNADDAHNDNDDGSITTNDMMIIPSSIIEQAKVELS